MYSDNGTNIVSASKEIKRYFSQLQHQSTVNNFIILYHLPPFTWFGGLWEAAVKSTKTLLFKITKKSLFTAEELHTLLCQVEGVLNSRPMTLLNIDSSDYTALTPAHFLIGGPLVQLPEPTISTEPKNRLKRWELVKFQTKHFWNRWSKEYLPQMQRRGRWHTPCQKIKEGDLAVLKEDHQPPLQWQLVRVTALHPGTDGNVRAVTLRSSLGKEFRRPVVKIALVPTSAEEDISSS